MASPKYGSIYQDVEPYSADTTQPVKDYWDIRNKDRALKIAEEEKKKKGNVNDYQPDKFKDLENSFVSSLAKNQLDLINKAGVISSNYTLQARNQSLSVEEQNKAEMSESMFKTNFNNGIALWGQDWAKSTETSDKITEALSPENIANYDKDKLLEAKSKIEGWIAGKYYLDTHDDGTTFYKNRDTGEDVSYDEISNIINFQPERKQTVPFSVEAIGTEYGSKWVLKEQYDGGSLFKTIDDDFLKKSADFFSRVNGNSWTIDVENKMEDLILSGKITEADPDDIEANNANAKIATDEAARDVILAMQSREIEDKRIAADAGGSGLNESELRYLDGKVRPGGGDNKNDTVTFVYGKPGFTGVIKDTVTGTLVKVNSDGSYRIAKNKNNVAYENHSIQGELLQAEKVDDGIIVTMVAGADLKIDNLTDPAERQQLLNDYDKEKYSVLIKWDDADEFIDRFANVIDPLLGDATTWGTGTNNPNNPPTTPTPPTTTTSTSANKKYQTIDDVPDDVKAKYKDGVSDEDILEIENSI